MALDGPARELFDRELCRLLDDDAFDAGRQAAAFEDEFGAYAGREHAVAVASGTAALEVLCRLLHRDEGEPEVLVQANTNYATVVAPARAGYRVTLVDVDPVTLAPEVEHLETARSDATRGVILAHIGGIVSPATPHIADWCVANGLWLVEDCAHAHGSRLGDRHAGTFGLAAAFSFFARKIVPAGEGGMILCDDADLAAEARLHRNLGKAPSQRNVHVREGTNARMSEMAAILGRARLLDLDARIARRRATLAGYAAALRLHEEVELTAAFGAGANGYRAPVLLPDGVPREELRTALQHVGVAVADEVYPLPLHEQPVLRGHHGQAALPGATRACAQQLCLPLADGPAEDVAVVTDRLLGLLAPDRALAHAGRARKISP
jgi:dTDP-4-amino-4,6-dideoxygalactose transaminase